MSNPAMPGLVKVGFTFKHPTQRAKELCGTGIPHPFKVEWSALVKEPRTLESRAHRDLKRCREGKEFFRCALDYAIAVVSKHVPVEQTSETLKPTEKKQSVKRQSVRLAVSEIVSTFERNGEFFAANCDEPIKPSARNAPLGPSHDWDAFLKSSAPKFENRGAYNSTRQPNIVRKDATVSFHDLNMRSGGKDATVSFHDLNMRSGGKDATVSFHDLNMRSGSNGDQSQQSPSSGPSASRIGLVIFFILQLIVGLSHANHSRPHLTNQDYGLKLRQLTRP